MAKKGLDSTFVHYGIRREDMSLIEALSLQHGIDADWLRDDVLKEYHERKLRATDLDERGVEKLIEKALGKLGR